MSYHRLPTAPLASRHRGAGGGAVDNQQPQGSTYTRPISVQSNGATSHNPQLLYELATWCVRIGHVPVRTLKLHYQDVQLFDILQRHGQIHVDTAWFDAMSAQAKDRLEKRLYHIWPIVLPIVQALQASTAPLRLQRHRKKQARKKMVASEYKATPPKKPSAVRFHGSAMFNSLTKKLNSL